jgi:hypothetical protein
LDEAARHGNSWQTALKKWYVGSISMFCNHLLIIPHQELVSFMLSLPLSQQPSEQDVANILREVCDFYYIILVYFIFFFSVAEDKASSWPEAKNLILAT